VRAVMTGIERVSRAGSRYVELPAAGFAIDPDLEDPTRLLAVVYGEFADAIVADGVLRHYLGHVALPALSEAVTNVGFGRSSIFAVRPAVPGTESSDVQVRIAGLDDLDAIARLSLVELRHRSTSPIFSVVDSRSHEQRRAEHRALVDRGAQHLIATLDGQDVGLLTIELSSPAPRLCPDGEPYIGPTATLPAARRRGVGHALVNAALHWAHRHGHRWVSVDFDPANPLSRPFWLGVGFRPTGYGVLRIIGVGS